MDLLFLIFYNCDHYGCTTPMMVSVQPTDCSWNHLHVKMGARELGLLNERESGGGYGSFTTMGLSCRYKGFATILIFHPIFVVTKSY